jgi:hypothetical protein
MINHYNLLTLSQKKLLSDQEQWMSDNGQKYTDERTRIDAIHDIIKRFPTEKLARDAVESGGDPSVLYLYYHGVNVNKKQRKSFNKKQRPIKRCKSK